MQEKESVMVVLVLIENSVTGENVMEFSVCTSKPLKILIILTYFFQDFMLELTKHQDSIGNVLREGNDLISESKVKQDEENEIRVQMGLLNNRWEELRLKALDRQSKWGFAVKDPKNSDTQKIAVIILNYFFFKNSLIWVYTF